LQGDYNQAVKVKDLHDWQVTTAQAEVIQRRLATLVSTKSEIASPQLIAGVDISPPNARGIATGAVVVLGYPQLRVVEIKVARQRLGFPYVPGLLSFRESPLILAACQKLAMPPDLILVDGQGIAHPRRLGIASHLGLLLDVPTIGCAKSRLCGAHDVVGETPGSFTELRDNGEVIGTALRTRERANPLYISIGHKIDLETAIFWVMECCRGYRIPEPTRLAHLAAAGRLESKEAEVEQERLFL
jgi:deoxyribonuclease V